jgi:hypothetical protein
MAIAILAAVVVLLVVGLVVAVWAARARRPFSLAYKLAPWSPDELDGLSSDLADVEEPDQIAALARADSATYAAGRAEVVSAAALEPVGNVRGDAPVVVLVAGAGFLGTGTMAALRECWRPRTAADLPRSREAGERRLRLA